jgi:hypothetical protein
VEIPCDTNAQKPVTQFKRPIQIASTLIAAAQTYPFRFANKMASSTRMRNSELAKKLKARAQRNDEQTSLLSKGRISSSDAPGSNRKSKELKTSAKSDEENDPYARFPFLAPFMVCQSPDFSSFEKKRDVVPPSTMNYGHSARRDYPVLNQEDESSGTKQQGEQGIKFAIKPASVGNTLVNSNSSPSLSSHSTPKRGHKQLKSPSTENFTSHSSTAESSLVTCAPSSVLVAGSTSATDSSPGNFSDTSSLAVCAPYTAMVAASTSATCPSVSPEPKQSPRSENKNFLRLIYDLDDKKDKNRGRANTSPKRPQAWKLSPFQKGRKSKKSEVESKKKHVLAIPIANRPTQQKQRCAPVDLDEVSVDSYDTEAGYYSDPTDADIRNITSIHTERHTDTSLGTGQVLANRKGLDSDRILSQLGMDVREDDYCIEGEYGMRRYPQHAHHNGHLRAGSGRWNYHQRKPSNGYSSRLVVGGEANAGKDRPQVHGGRRRGSKLGENIKGSMKKIGSIIKLSDDEESEKDRGGRKQQQRHTSDKLGSKVLSMLRGHHKGNPSIPQSIIITPSASEDPEMNMTSDDLELVHRWQRARARTRENQSSPKTNHRIITPNANSHTDRSAHKRNESLLSITNSMVSEKTAHVNNRKEPPSEGPGHWAECSF